MYVCVCNGITDRDICAAAGTKVSSFADLQAATGCSTCCGRCEETARAVFDEAVNGRIRPAAASPLAAAV